MKTAAEIREWLTEQIAGILSVSVDEIDPDETFDSFGLASRDAVSLSGDLEDYLDRRLSPTLLYQYPTITELAEHLAAAGTEPAKPIPGPKPVAHVAKQPAVHEKSPAAVVPSELNAPAQEPVAIVGVACRFPGADSAEALWEALASGRDLITEVPDDRWDREGLYDPETGAPGKMNTKWGGFLSDIASWDAHFFGVSPREAARMDPQQRLLCESAWEALEDAGIPADRLAGSNTGVFVGISSPDYSRLQVGVAEHMDAYTGTGNAFSIAANRISYLFDFRGPSLAVDTACSSSLVATHLACQSLARGECDFALAGGVNVILSPEVTISFSQAHMMAADGRCKTFDASADGYVRAEGVGVVALKRLSDALRDGNRIIAVIRGSAVNQDGRSNGLTAPNPDAQEAVIRQALANAGVLPSQVSYVEAHGTGTSLGDPIELRALAASLSPGRPEGAPVAIAAVKTNLGHLESAAGIASLIKVALMIRHRQIPPSLHFKEPNPHGALESAPLRVQTALGPWETFRGLPRIAGISSFGFGGTNAHLIVCEHPDRAEVEARATAGPDDRAYLLPLSAASPAALEGQARRWLDFLAATGSAPASIASSAATGRSHLDYRLSVIGRTTQEWRAGLVAFLAHESAPRLRTGQRSTGKRRKVALVYSGQGTQWPGMGRELLDEKQFRLEVEAIDALWKDLAGWSIEAALVNGDGLDRTDVAQPAIFALQAGLTAVLKSWGLAVEGTTGHSVGEIAAAYAGGILSLADAVKVLYHRSRLMQAATGLGKMAAIGVSEAEARELLRGHEKRVSLAAINSPSLVTLSGEPEALDEIVGEAKARGIFSRPLQVNYAFHSPQMEPFLDELLACVDGIETRPAALAVYSTVTGKRATAGDFAAVYWPRNVRQTVRFADAIRGLAEDGFDAFVEVSPHAGMVRSISECLPGGTGYLVAGSLQREKPERETLLVTAGELYCAGLTPSWPREWPVLPRVEIPRYAWNRQRYWAQVPSDRGLSPASIAAQASRAAPEGHPLTGHEVRSPALQGKVFEQALSARQPAYLADHRVAGSAVLPAAAYLEMSLVAGRQALRAREVALGDVSFERLLPLSKTPRVTQVVVEEGQARVYSDAEGEWALHAVATVMPEAEPETASTLAIEDIKARCPGELPVGELYDGLRERGLDYGPAFRGVTRLWRRDGEGLGRVSLPASLSAEGYILHPALLDACFHVVAAALPETNAGGPDVVQLPVGVERLAVSRDGEGLSQAWAHVTLRPADAREPEFLADIEIAGESGTVVAEVTGLRLRAAPRAVLALILAPREPATGNRSEAGSGPAPDGIDGWAYELRWEELTGLQAAQERWAEGRWLLLADEGGVAARLRDAIGAAGGEARLIDPGEDVAAAMGADLSGLRGVIHLRGLDASPGGVEAVLRGLLTATQSLARASAATAAKPPTLWIVTQGAVAIAPSEGASPSQAALWGFGNVAALEQPELSPVRVDLDGSRAAENLLLAELATPNGEDRLALRDGKRMGARLRRAGLPSVAASGAVDSREPLRLEITERGMLDNLARLPMTRIEPGPGQVEIEVRAAGLNFRDVMNLLGLYPGDAGLLGGECAGVVARVGAGVSHVAAGDRVMAIAPGCFGSFTTTHGDLVAHIPGKLSFEEAATIPIAFLTAHYALDRLGKMAAGDKVLIHAASGGVGLAAIQLAQLAGAEVFATAGNPAKREFLQGLGIAHVMNSRNVAFSDQTLAATGGRGVDLVLNSLSGDFIPKSLAALAPDGRFLEIGKVGIWNAAQVAQLKPGAMYRTVALDDLSARQPELVGEMLAELAPHFEAGRLRPLTKTVYPVEDASSAFRLMAQTRHIGKVVITQPATSSGERATSVGIRAGATYLITGGLGSLGMLVAERLVNLGARNLLLLGVAEPSEPAQAKIADLERAGARVVVLVADVSRMEEAQRALEQIEDGGMPPLRGIIHAAGVLDDGLIQQQDWSRFERVLRPKAGGAWNLHRLTETWQLDFFVSFSSVAAVLGSPGQANYAAANAFMDGLAARRTGGGLPGLSIAWGPWSVGMAAGDGRNAGLARQRREASGLNAIEPQLGLDALERLLLGGARGQVVVAPIAWPALRARIPVGEEPAFLKSWLAAPAARVDTKPTKGSAPSGAKPPLVVQLEAAAPGDRQALLVAYIRERALRVMALDPDYPLDTRKPVNEMGLDSLMAVELKNALDAGIGRKLPATLVFEHPTIEALAKHLLDNVLGSGGAPAARGEVAGNKAEGPKPAFAPISEQAVAEMTEEEAEAALLQKLLELDE